MKPTIALVGRPNVGKSTLLTASPTAKMPSVADMPGLTRDRHYGHGKIGSKPYLVIDTGGFEPVVDSGILHEMAKRTLQKRLMRPMRWCFLWMPATALPHKIKSLPTAFVKAPRPVFSGRTKARAATRAVLAAEFYELALGAAYRDFRRPRRWRLPLD